jgi:HNH endonuclease
MAQVLLNASDAQRAQGHRPAVLFYSPVPQPQPQPGSAPTPASTPASASMQDLASSPDAAAAVASVVPLIPPGCVETCYGEVVPAARVVPKSTAMHLTLAADGQPVTLDGQPIDQDADARLASRAQRIALDFLHRQCTYPGCTRPAMWSLHAHHVISYSAGGPTTIKNMTLLCSQHHVLTHQDAA